LCKGRLRSKTPDRFKEDFTRCALPQRGRLDHHSGVRVKLVVLTAIVALAAAVAVVAAAETTANGLPSYTNGYQKWPKINAKPIRNEDPRSGHAGTKNVYASKRKARSKWPNGTVIVKSIVAAGTKYIGKVAVMRKVNGRWQWVEYTRSGPRARYGVLARDQICTSCHVQAKANDWVFTKR
jgi:hypothetical protein